MSDGDLLIGTVLDGKYSVDRLLGRGGMGEVYAGTHEALGRAVAIKVLHAGLTINQSFVARFEREARTTAMFEHPNAVHVHDFGTLADGSRYLVMEFIEGVTLRDILRANTALEPGIAVDLIIQAASAVAEAHAHGIIHRDLKPENMMVRRDENGGLFLKVVDFGLAKNLANSATLLTNASEIMGTPRYMAPEQFQGLAVDGRADVYALGCVLFELLTGRTPYEGTILEIVGQHVHAPIPPVTRDGTDIPTLLQTTVQRSLVKDPIARFESAHAFARELQAAAEGLSASPMLVAIPAASEELFGESSGHSDLTAMPDVPDFEDIGPTDVINETKPVHFATGALGDAVPTVSIPVTALQSRRWQLPAALGFAGVIILTGLSFQGRVLDGQQVAPAMESIPEVAPSASQTPVPDPMSTAVTVSTPPPGVPDNTTPAPNPASASASTAPNAKSDDPRDRQTDTSDTKKDNRGVLPTVGAKTKDVLVGTGRQAKRLGSKIRRGIPGLKPKKSEPR